MTPPVIPNRAWLANQRDPSWMAAAPDPRPLAFHRDLPDYAATPLVELVAVAHQLGVGRVFAKVESHRLGLPAFKALGASWAVRRVLDETAQAGDLTIVAATDGNHGRAVARFACLFGHKATVFVPDAVHPVAIEAIRAEGADVVQISGSYDDAVGAAAKLGLEHGYVLVQDTAWDGYEDVPGWIVDGYDTLFVEIDDQLRAAAVDRLDLVVIPTGVGSLLQAGLVHYRQLGIGQHTAIVSVEPTVAACVQASLLAGHPVTVATEPTAMAGLNCGTISTIAWPTIVAGLDAAIITDDAAAGDAAAQLAALDVDAGPCGAASLAALVTVFGLPDADQFRDHVGLDADSTVVLLITEGTAANPSLSA